MGGFDILTWVGVWWCFVSMFADVEFGFYVCFLGFVVGLFGFFVGLGLCDYDGDFVSFVLAVLVWVCCFLWVFGEIWLVGLLFVWFGLG